MNITADTNVLVRFLIGDDKEQAHLAGTALADADVVALPTAALCEVVWVLRTAYKVPREQIAASLTHLISAENARCDRLAVEQGMAVLKAGGDFADGVIAFEGSRLGGPEFITFDQQAAKLVASTGALARLLSKSQTRY